MPTTTIGKPVISIPRQSSFVVPFRAMEQVERATMIPQEKFWRVNLAIDLQDHRTALTTLRNIKTTGLDMIYTSNVINKLPKKDWQELFTESHRLLKPHGWLINSFLNDETNFFSRDINKMYYVFLLSNTLNIYKNKMEGEK